MAIRNPSFSDAGLFPGEAQHWTFFSETKLESIAGFGAEPETAWEDFEQWGKRLSTLEDLTVVRAFFDATSAGFEGFERGWENNLYLFEHSPALLIAAALGPNNVEDFESSWPGARTILSRRKDQWQPPNGLILATDLMPRPWIVV